MTDTEFETLLGELRREVDATDATKLTAKLLEALREENKMLRRIVQELIDSKG